MSDDEYRTIIIDAGSTCKIGFAGETSPREIFPTVVGMYKYRSHMIGMSSRDSYVGYEVESMKFSLLPLYPISKGIVTDWDNMEKIWHHSFYNELRIAPEDNFVFLTDSPLTPKAFRERTTQIMFETFYVLGLYISSTSLLSLYSCGKTSGLVVDCGDSCVTITPMVDGCPIIHGINQINLGGKDVGSFVSDVLNKRNHISFGQKLIEEIKSKYCYVAKDFDAELDQINFSTFHLSNGSSIIMHAERLECTELIFQPKRFGRTDRSIQEAIIDSLTTSQIKSKDVILCGGNSLFPGFSERLSRDLKQLELNIIASASRGFSAFLGCSLVSSLAGFCRMYISRTEYDEKGLK